LSYTVLENFLPLSIQDEIERKFQFNTKWNYVSYTSGNEHKDVDELNENIIESPQFIHQSMWNGIKDESFHLLALPLYFLEGVSGCTVSEIFKIKTNMNLMDSRYEGEKYHPPHADHKSSEYFTMIYYIKDSDGPTRFFNKKITDPFPSRDLKLTGEVHPKKGTAILFKSNQMHTGTCPTNTENRLVTNFVFKATNLTTNFTPIEQPIIRNISE